MSVLAVRRRLRVCCSPCSVLSSCSVSRLGQTTPWMVLMCRYWSGSPLAASSLLTSLLVSGVCWGGGAG